MTEEMNYDDEIDLREIVQTLWNARVLIVGVVVGVTLTAFVVTSWLLPRKYQASAYLLLSKPVFAGTFDLNAFNPLPALTDLTAEASRPDVLNQVLLDPAVAESFGKEKISANEFAGSQSATALGVDRISLQVTDSDPQRVTLLANKWAEKVAQDLNKKYRFDATVRTIHSRYEQKQQAYQQAQTALEEALSGSQTVALNAQYNQKLADLNNTLAVISRDEAALSELSAFETQLDAGAAAPLFQGEAIALSLPGSQSPAKDSANYLLQINGAAYANLTLSGARLVVSQKRAALENRIAQSQREQLLLAQELPKLQQKVENARSKLTELTTVRDIAKAELANLLPQEYGIRSIEQTMDLSALDIVQVSATATPPGAPVPGNVLKNTALSGMAGLMLVVMWVLLQNWWQTGGGKP